MPSSGYKSCPLCNRNFDKEKTGHDATKYLEYEKRKQEIAELRTANAKLLATTTEQIGALKRQLKDKEREIESLKKRQSHEQKKNVPLGNTKIQRVSEGKSLSKSTQSSLRASKTNVLKTNLLKKNEITRKKTLSPLSKKIQSKEKQTAVKLKNNIQKVSKEKSTLLHPSLSKQKNVKSIGNASVVVPDKTELKQKNVEIDNIHEKSSSIDEQNLKDIEEGFLQSVKEDELLTGLKRKKVNQRKKVNLIKKSPSPIKRNTDAVTDSPRPKDASSNKEFSEFQSHEQSRSGKINGSYVNLNSNSINRYMK